MNLAQTLPSTLPTLLILILAARESMAHDQPLQIREEDHEHGEEWFLDSIVLPRCREDHDQYPAICVCWHHGYLLDDDGARTDQPGCLDYFEDRSSISASRTGASEVSLTLEDRILIQKVLASFGFNVRAVDGVFGAHTGG